MIVSLIIWNTPYIPAIENFLGEKITECRTKEEAMSMLPEAEIAIVMGGAGLTIDEDMLNAGKKLKLILSVSAGVEKLPLKQLHDRGIAVCNSKGAHAVTIAEFVLGGMLAMSHHFPAFMRNQANAQWRTFFSGDDLEGQTLCVIGAGSIGSEIGKKAKAFDMRVLGLKRKPEPLEYFDEVWGIERLHEALGQSDYVALITPLTPETYHLMGVEEFRVMKDTSVFMNVSRGDTVDEAALINALKRKQIAGAFLDVFHTEPLPKESPLWTMENVVVTPHNAGPSTNSERKTVKLLCDNIIRFRQGRELVNKVQEFY
jgi:D-2-hydroxyacid dehydrogenase (NADP+)